MAKEGRLVDGIEIPKGTLPANTKEQKYDDPYSKRLYYKDIYFKCKGCNVDEVWTMEQQKRYFEVQKGNIYNEPTWCYKCHKERVAKKKPKERIPNRGSSATALINSTN